MTRWNHPEMIGMQSWQWLKGCTEMGKTQDWTSSKAIAEAQRIGRLILSTQMIEQWLLRLEITKLLWFEWAGLMDLAQPTESSLRKQLIGSRAASEAWNNRKFGFVAQSREAQSASIWCVIECNACFRQTSMDEWFCQWIYHAIK